MDLIKETYDLLNHYLGVDHRGGKKLDSEYDELKGDIQALVIHALKTGKALGANIVHEKHREFLSTLSKYYVELHQDVCNDRYKSKADVSE